MRSKFGRRTAIDVADPGNSASAAVFSFGPLGVVLAALGPLAQHWVVLAAPG